ncbi:sigma-70 family RNA polymerase sigma factor [Actinoplanes sp. LDG1-06]|uniref:Sigma-70 family RNA polymerase sigma factor n=1 Tax=Paractinoplanes ovalisporus TaxID=2810368 RepID=A0ABS2A858_9ACTN|nr:sigma-70 family RNA polymerase sigma factor [Actinoplanes ovalisporus]MBM2615503.1 sigma-70 family RNA polymerase sigma factor [Actinoplanes ovalisporus]
MDDPEAYRVAPATPHSAPPDEPDRAEFDDFYRSYMPRLVAFLRYQGAQLAEASDLAQDAMIKAYAKWPDITSPKAWTKRVASREWGRRLASVDDEPVTEAHGSLLTVPDVVAWEQQFDLVRLLDQLPLRQRQVLAWTLDGYTPAEIAVELQLTPETVRSNLYKARRAVEKHLEEGS